MIKLVKNELIKILKKRNIYFLFLLAIIIIIIYNCINPDQNIITSSNNSTNNIPIKGMETNLDNLKENTEEYITQKATIEFYKLYNSFEKDSWQRYALNEERNKRNIDNVYTDYNIDIMNYLYNITDYQFNSETKTNIDKYEYSKTKFDEYVKALNLNDWKKFVNLKIENLEEEKNKEELLEAEIEEIELEIEIYKIRLYNNINFGNNVSNQYIEQYKNNYYNIKSYQVNSYSESQDFINKSIDECKAQMELYKYALENNIEYDISNEKNLINNNKIDARIAFIRVFKHFNLIIVVIAIYISSTIITEEINKKTIKNLLTKPHKRRTILIAKMIACMVIIIITMIFIAFVQYIVGGIIFGFDSYTYNYIGYNYNTSQVFILNLFKYIVIVGFTKIFMYLIIIIFCILIGIMNKNIAMSMVLTLIVFLIFDTVMAEWSKVETFSVITRFFITNNWDFSVFLFGNTSNISGITLFTSIITYLIYFIIMFKISLTKFKKLEI